MGSHSLARMLGARYRLTMGPWLDWLSLRLDSFVFQDKTALQIIEEVFADYPAAQWRLQVSPHTQAALRVRSLCTQYRETDLAFVTRLLAQEGFGARQDSCRLSHAAFC